MGDISFGNGIFVATGKYNVIATALISRDGVHWNPTNWDREFYSVVFGNGRFVLLGSTNNYTSTDGVNWTPIPNGAPFIDLSPQLVFSNGVFVDFSGTNTKFATSTDGINWQTQDMGLIDYSGTGKIFPNIGVTGAVYGNGKYVVAATYYPNTQAGGNTYPIVITSPDAVKWTMTKLDESCYLERIAYGNGVFVATGANGGILTSPDGINWTARDTGAKTSYGTVSFCNDKFVALGEGGLIDLAGRRQLEEQQIILPGSLHRRSVQLRPERSDLPHGCRPVHRGRPGLRSRTLPGGCPRCYCRLER